MCSRLWIFNYEILYYHDFLGFEKKIILKFVESIHNFALLVTTLPMLYDLIIALGISNIVDASHLIGHKHDEYKP